MRIHLYTLFICAKYRCNQVTHLYFIVIFAMCAKINRSPIAPLRLKKKKKKKLERNFECPYLTNGSCEFNHIYCVAYPTWGTAIMQKWCVLEKGPWSYAHMKKLFPFFLSIYTHGVAHRLTWQHNTLPCALIKPQQTKQYGLHDLCMKCVKENCQLTLNNVQ